MATTPCSLLADPAPHDGTMLSREQPTAIFCGEPVFPMPLRQGSAATPNHHSPMRKRRRDYSPTTQNPIVKEVPLRVGRPVFAPHMKREDKKIPPTVSMDEGRSAKNQAEDVYTPSYPDTTSCITDTTSDYDFYYHPEFFERFERFANAFAYETGFDPVELGWRREGLHQNNLAAFPHSSLNGTALHYDEGFETRMARLANARGNAVLLELMPALIPWAEALGSQDQRYSGLAQGCGEMWTDPERVGPGFPAPRPDYFVGFSSRMFDNEQLRKIDLILGPTARVTRGVCFPFFTCQVAKPLEPLEIADRKNFHNMVVCMKGLVRLFEHTSGAGALDHRIVGMSVSHNHSTVNVHGYYMDLFEKFPRFRRVKLRGFDFVANRGEQRSRPREYVEYVVYNRLGLWLRDLIWEAVSSLPG